MIVTPVLNGARFVEATLDSIGRQSHQDWRHVFIDGGSTDGTIEILRRRAEQDMRVSVIERQGSSLYEALFDGFNAVDPDSIVGWLNADDLYAPWALAAVFRLMSTPCGPLWLSGLPALWDCDGELRSIQATAWRPRAAIRRGWFHDGFLGCLQQETIFFRKSLIDGLHPDERATVIKQKLAGDFALWKAFARQSSVVTVPLLLGGFRAHGKNRSVRESDLYSCEIRALNAPTPPAWLARRVRTFFELISSAANVYAFRRAAHNLHEDM